MERPLPSSDVADGALEALQEELALSVKELSTILGVPERTIARREDEGHLTAAESDRLYRVARTLEMRRR